MIGSMEIYMVFHAAYLVLSGILFAMCDYFTFCR